MKITDTGGESTCLPPPEPVEPARTVAELLAENERLKAENAGAVAGLEAALRFIRDNGIEAHTALALSASEHEMALGMPRSGYWPAAAKVHLRKHPRCEACGAADAAQVHHIEPFHLFPTKELDPDNLLTLCPVHHLTFGHLMSWKSYNSQVRTMVAEYHRLVKSRP